MTKCTAWWNISSNSANRLILIDILTAGVGSDDIFSNANNGRNNDGELDPMYDDAVACVVKTRKASISSVQRHLRIGYNRAARLIDQMEADGIVSAPESCLQPHRAGTAWQ